MDIRKCMFRKAKDAGFIRNEWVKEQIIKYCVGGELLDCGAGEQRYRKWCINVNYTSQDFCQFNGKAVVGMDQNDKWDTSKIDIVSDIIDIPVKNESYDYILCTEVLEHIKRPDLAIKEFARIIKTGGKVILTAPFASYTHMAPYHYCSGFDRYWWEEILKDNGFDIIEITPNSNYFDCVATDIRRIPQVSKLYSKKVNVFERAILYTAIRIIVKLSMRDNGSSEFGCNGYMVVAEKSVDNKSS